MRSSSAQQLNGLWIARKKAGLEQKVVARLLNQKSTSQISEYERGRLLPNLRTAIKLSVIYGTSLKNLYRELYSQAESELGPTGKLQPPIQPRISPLYDLSARAHFGS